MSSRRRRKRRPARRAWLPDLKLPVLEQRHWDLIGLGLVAFAAFFACVFYLDWAGGEVGEALSDAILFMFGGVGYAAPVLMFATGALIVVRPMIPALHPLKTGIACLVSALMLGLAAGSLGLGPGDTPRDGFLDASYLEHHGGLVGESMFWLSAKLFSTAGSHILFVFLLLAGILLLTGASIASIVTATRQAAATTTERMRRTAPLPPIVPPEPEDREPVVRATHVEMPTSETEEFDEYEPEP
jgi:S-DNA-T family DNA segregation ATPase FtsK/SpoIIIE